MKRDDLVVEGADNVWAVLRFDQAFQEQDGAGVARLRDGSYVAALQVYPPNYSMLTAQAVDALLDNQLRPALNRVTFDFAVVVRARRPDIAPWLAERREHRMHETSATLLRLGLELDTILGTELRTRDVIEREMALLVPYSGEVEGPDDEVGIFTRRSRKKAPEAVAVATEEVLRVLHSRCELLADILRQIGCQTVRMGLLALLSWFYEVYNPDRAQRQPLDERSIVGLMAPLRTLAQARLQAQEE